MTALPGEQHRQTALEGAAGDEGDMGTALGQGIQGRPRLLMALGDDHGAVR
nr:hypothetical protein [Streptomyces ipomoeae]